MTAGSAVLPLTLEETGLRLGRCVWVEEALFERLGAWAADEPDHEAKVLLAVHSRHHGWRAEVLREHLPERHGVATDDLVQAPPAVPAAVDALGGGTTVERLAGVYRALLPRLVAAYDHHLGRLAPVADAPLGRALVLVVGDEVADWREGEALLQRLLATPQEVRAATAAAARVERLVVAAGGVLGPATLGEGAGSARDAAGRWVGETAGPGARGDASPRCDP